MNSCLLLTGNLRTLEKHFSIYKSIIEKYDCDIFIFASFKKFQLHPYKKELHNFYNETIINDTIINGYFEKLFEKNENLLKKIKYVKIYDKFDEDNINKNAQLFSDNKKFVGRDIYMQNTRRLDGIKYIKQFEITNNIIYNYIILTRYDIDKLSIESLPKFPLDTNTIYISKDNNDVINIGNSCEIFNHLLDNILSLFFIKQKNLIFDNIHNMIEHSYENLKLTLNRNILLNITNNYDNMFNTDVTLVSCFYNINRDKWKNYYRNVDKYFENSINILNKKNPIVIFTTEDNNDKIYNLRKKYDPYLIYTKIININFEDLPMFKYKDVIEKTQKLNINNIPTSYRDCPEFCEPLYNIVINSKPYFLKLVCDNNYFLSNIFQWIDFGFHNSFFSNNHNIFPENYFSNIFYKNNKIRLIGFNKLEYINITDIKKYYNSHNNTIAACMMAGNKYSINKLYKLFNDEFHNMLSNNLMNQEQYILEYILKTNTDLFDYIETDSWNNVVFNYSQNTISIALAFSGHFRSFDICYDNIKNNIINVLNKHNLNIKLYISSWNDIGFRSDNFNSEIIDLNNYKFKIIKEVFSKYEFENKLSDNFYKYYSSNDYINYPKLCNKDTFGDSASMLYKMNCVFEDIIKSDEKFDIIIRMRPDIVYNYKIDINNIKKCLYEDIVYMPESHNNFIEVTKNIMDHFFYGNTNTMKHLMTTFKNIDDLKKTDCPHTCEGFLWKQINNNNIEIERFMTSYKCIYKNNQYFTVI